MSIIHDKIQVIVRIRPPRRLDSPMSTKLGPNTICIKDKQYSFNNVYDIYTNQISIFDISVKPLIDEFLIGINTTIFAYGQTGSGKTYTMGTNQTNIHFQDNNCGIIPRFLFHIFQKVTTSNHKFEFSIQFLELYNEEIRDLLTPRNQPSHIRITDSKHGVRLVGLTEKTAYSAIEALFYLNEGNKSRTTGFTAMNSESSRSHAIFTFNLTQRKLNKDTGQLEILKSKFNFVDLAGSERLQRTKAVGTRAKEGININFGLLALGNVICALSESGPHSKRHIPYRDSKLTRLLEDSLGGNSKCMMIACVCPSMENLSETCNTLSYANRVNSIENKISVNHRIESNCDSECNNCYKLQHRITELEKELAALKSAPKDACKFEGEVEKIIENQKVFTKQTYQSTTSNFDSLCNLISLEQNLKLLECLPNNDQSSYEKISVHKKIVSLKSVSMKDSFGKNPQKTSLIDFLDKTSYQTKINALKINNFVITNTQDHKKLDPIKSHELRWSYLVNFTCQQYIIKDCLQQEIINLYEEQLSRFYQLFKTFISKSNPTLSLISELISMISKHNPFAINELFKANTPSLALQNLESNLNRLFPLFKKVEVKVENSGRKRKISIESNLNDTLETSEENISNISSDSKSMDSETVSEVTSYKRLKIMPPPLATYKKKMPQNTFEGKIFDKGFLKPNGLCLPIINSPEKAKENIAKLYQNKSIFNALLTNQTNAKVNSASHQKLDVVANFRLRNLKTLRR